MVVFTVFHFKFMLLCTKGLVLALEKKLFQKKKKTSINLGSHFVIKIKD